MFPKFLLKKMYEKHSLSINENKNGFSFIIKNSIANGHVVEVYLLSLNDEEIPFDMITITNETQEMRADKISAETPVELKKGVHTKFSIESLDALKFMDQEVKIHMKFKVRVHDSKMTIDFDFHDILKSN